jgi:hypothetical protein
MWHINSTLVEYRARRERALHRIHKFSSRLRKAVSTVSGEVVTGDFNGDRNLSPSLPLSSLALVSRGQANGRAVHYGVDILGPARWVVVGPEPACLCAALANRVGPMKLSPGLQRKANNMHCGVVNCASRWKWRYVLAVCIRLLSARVHAEHVVPNASMCASMCVRMPVCTRAGPATLRASHARLRFSLVGGIRVMLWGYTVLTGRGCLMNGQGTNREQIGRRCVVGGGRHGQVQLACNSDADNEEAVENARRKLPARPRLGPCRMLVPSDPLAWARIFSSCQSREWWGWRGSRGFVGGS